MIYLKEIAVIIGSFGFGFLSSGGIFTVFVTVGLVPRLADKTHSAEQIELYESSIVSGTILGCILSVFPIRLASITQGFKVMEPILCIFGIFSGMFIGCFAIAIAEMLNTIPIFSRRIALGKGMGLALLFLALGKTIGSVIYFFYF